MDISDYTQYPLDHEGVFRAFPVAWTVEQASSSESKSVAIAFRFAVHQEWHGKEQGWSQEWPAGYFVENRSWVVKKDGTLNQGAVDALAKCGLWNGDFDTLAGPVANVFVLLDVKADVYEGRTRYRADWINPNAEEPTARGGFHPADTSLLASLRQRFQGQTRAIAGGKPAGSPPPPPKAHPPAGVAPQPTASAPPAAAPAAPPAAPRGGAVAVPTPTPSVGGTRHPPVAPPVVAPPTPMPGPASGDDDDPFDPDETPF